MPRVPMPISPRRTGAAFDSAAAPSASAPCARARLAAAEQPRKRRRFTAIGGMVSGSCPISSGHPCARRPGMFRFFIVYSRRNPSQRSTSRGQVQRHFAPRMSRPVGALDGLTLSIVVH